MDANIQGHAGWKREISSSDNETETASLPASIEAETERATSQWSIEENVTYSAVSAADLEAHFKDAGKSVPSTNMRRAKRNTDSSLQARAYGGIYLGSIQSGGKIFAMYRAATVVLNGLQPNDRDLANTLIEWMGDTIDSVVSEYWCFFSVFV